MQEAGTPKNSFHLTSQTEFYPNRKKSLVTWVKGQNDGRGLTRMLSQNIRWNLGNQNNDKK